MPNIRDLMLAKLASSGLTPEHAEQLQMLPLNAAALEALGHRSPRDGFVIPYFDLDGHTTEFHRVRFLKDPPMNEFKFVDQKPQRYSQIAGTTNEVYLPPIVPWRALASEPSIPLYITEGELKAAAACTRDLPTMGLGGVFNFGAAKQHMRMLPIFDEIVWKGREVNIIFDSDAIKNPMVRAAESRLSRLLLERGAKPYVRRLPQINGSKVGLDDYLLDHTPEDVDKLPVEDLAATMPLHELNETCAIIKWPACVVELGTFRRWTRRDFTSLAYGGRIYVDEREDAKGNIKRTEKNAAEVWVDWPSANRFEGLVYSPGKPSVINQDLNTWKGWGVQPKKGNIEPWKKLLDYIFGKDKAARKWFEQWLAYPLQHPGEKLYTASVLWSAAHGTGKSLIGITMQRIYGVNWTKIKDKDLGSSFNSWAANRQFVLGEEIGSTSDKRGVAEELKDMIAGTTIKVNEKFVPEYDIVDCVNYLFTSNKPDAFYLNRQDRRFFVWRMPEKPLPPEFYQQEYHDWMHSDEGAAALFYHLLHVDLTGFAPRGHAPVTDAKLEMTFQGGGDIGRFVWDLVDDPDRVLPDKRSLWTLTELLAVFDQDHRHTQKALANEMASQGLRQANKGQPVRMTDGKQQRLWVLRKREELEQASAHRVRTVYEEERKNMKRSKVQ